MASPPTSHGFRTDLQALRAVAVGMVVLNHLWPQHLGGGYVGVDVFFVISGFLITGHLTREARVNGRIALAKFWARRAKRLLPAAILVLAASVLMTLIWLPVTTWGRELTQVGAAAVYILNWALSFAQLDYFQLGQDQTLVTHYWSLSVEEQFYLVWPLLLVAAIWFTRTRGARTKRVAFAALIAVVLLASFAWATFSATRNPTSAYFETTTRAWEFAAGALLSFAPSLSERNRTRLLPFLWIGWAMIAGSAFLLSPTSGVPGPVALIPALGTMLVIGIGEGSSPWSPRALTSFRPVQILGDVSYSLYLWHWPLIVIAPHVIGRGLTAADKVVILAISIVLAILTKQFVEDPMRFRVLGKVRPRIVLSAALVSMLIVGGGTVAGAFSLEHRERSLVAGLDEESREPGACFGAQAALSGAECSESNLLANADYLLARAQFNLWSDTTGGTECEELVGVHGSVRNCSFGAADPAVGVGLVGDSHAEMWAGALDSSVAESDARVYTYLQGGCSATTDLTVEFVAAPAEQIQKCNAWRKDVVPMVANDDRFDVIITSAYGAQYSVDGQPDPGAGVVEAWQEWIDAGKRVIVIGDMPVFPTTLCGSPDTWDAGGCVLGREQALSPTGLSRAVDQMPVGTIEFVDYTDIICDSECHSIVGGIPVFYDGNHLNTYFARSFGPTWLSDLLRDES